MKFDAERVNSSTAGIFVTDSTLELVDKGDADALISIIRAYSRVCGEKTRQKMLDAIVKKPCEPDFFEIEKARYGIDYSDTPIRGISYVYLWFDCNGELFYIGKGKYNRVEDKTARNSEFKRRAEGGYYRILAYNMDEIYALDLESILILEATYAGIKLVNIKSPDGISAVQYCTNERDALLWYWDHFGTITRFSELTGIEALYSVEGKSVFNAIDSRWRWYANYDHPKTNIPEVLEKQRKAEAKKQKQREYSTRYRERKKKEQEARA